MNLKAEAAEKERLKEENRRLRKLENEVKTVWIEAGLNSGDSYETAKKMIIDKDVFVQFEKEDQVEKIWEVS